MSQLALDLIPGSDRRIVNALRVPVDTDRGQIVSLLRHVENTLWDAYQLLALDNYSDSAVIANAIDGVACALELVQEVHQQEG